MSTSLLLLIVVIMLTYLRLSWELTTFKKMKRLKSKSAPNSLLLMRIGTPRPLKTTFVGWNCHNKLKWVRHTFETKKDSNCYHFLDDNIGIISLASAGSDPSAGEIVRATGWGRPSDSSQGISDVLREVDVPVLSNSDCHDFFNIITDGNVCIDSAGGHGQRLRQALW